MEKKSKKVEKEQQCWKKTVKMFNKNTETVFNSTLAERRLNRVIWTPRKKLIYIDEYGNIVWKLHCNQLGWSLHVLQLFYKCIRIKFYTIQRSVKTTLLLWQMNHSLSTGQFPFHLNDAINRFAWLPRGNKGETETDNTNRFSCLFQ